MKEQLLNICVITATIEVAIDRIKANVYHEAQDTDWDLGFNKCKEMVLAELEKMK